MTALERLRLAAGPGGSTGDALKRMGRGAGLAGALLVAYSGLASATAAEHLLHVVDRPQQIYGSGARAAESDDELRRIVQDKWEAIERAQAEDRAALLAARVPAPAPAPVPATVPAVPVPVPVLVPVPDAEPGATQFAGVREPVAQSGDAAVDAAALALAEHNKAALLVLLALLDD
jgi:hypothetical protein